MLERVDKLIDEEASSMWIGTFHSICMRILRKNIERIGYTSNFTIYDSGDQNTLVSDCIKELNLSKDVYKSRGILATISHLKNEDIDPDSYIKEHYVDFMQEMLEKYIRYISPNLRVIMLLILMI